MATNRTPKKAFTHLPYMASFKALFIAAQKKYPGKTLGYAGSSLGNGDNFMQERSNPVPFIITDAELQAALAGN